jgi:hypothetical protein
MHTAGERAGAKEPKAKRALVALAGLVLVAAASPAAMAAQTLHVYGPGGPSRCGDGAALVQI